MLVVNRARSKGTREESALVEFLRSWFPHVHRLPMSSPSGDIGGVAGGTVIEVKNHTAMDLSTWCNQAQKSAKGDKDWVVFHHRRGKGVADGYATTNATFMATLLKYYEQAVVP